MGDNKKLAKLGIIVTAVVIVFGVALFVFKGQEKKVEPVENDFSVTRIQEDTPNEVDLIENENKYNEVETEKVEDIEEIVDKAIEEMDKVDTDHLEGITIHSNEDSEETESVDSEETDSEKSDSSKEGSDKADSSKDSSEKSDSNKGNNEKSDSEKSDSNVDNSTTNKVDTEQGNTETKTENTNAKTENNGQVNNGEKNSTVQETTPSQPAPVTPAQTVPQTQSSDDQMRALFGDAYIGDVSGASGPGVGLAGQLE